MKSALKMHHNALDNVENAHDLVPHLSCHLRRWGAFLFWRNDIRFLFLNDKIKFIVLNVPTPKYMSSFGQTKESSYCKRRDDSRFILAENHTTCPTGWFNNINSKLISSWNSWGVVLLRIDSVCIISIIMIHEQINIEIYRMYSSDILLLTESINGIELPFYFFAHPLFTVP